MAAVVAAWVAWAVWICKGLTCRSQSTEAAIVLYKSSVGLAWRSIFFEMAGGYTPAVTSLTTPRASTMLPGSPHPVVRASTSAPTILSRMRRQ